jgi:hypothetical protein
MNIRGKGRMKVEERRQRGFQQFVGQSIEEW